MELEHIPFTLHEIFSHCQALIKPKTEEKGLALYCYAEPSIGKTLLGDPVKLRQALINLLTNAVKFTHIGTVKFLASIVSLTDNNAIINFEVKDSGIGMTPEQTERVFKPFMQADDTITRRYGGTGLGLTIAKNIVEMMGGTLEVESTPGVGSKFSFELRFDIVDEPHYIPVHKIVLSEIGKPNFHGEILICEDNEMNQNVICEHLERVGLKTFIADNGRDGYEMVKRRKQNNEKPFDLIFMDIHMPVMDGLEAATKITALGVKTPIVAMTANIMTNDIELYKKSGIPDCVNKPFTSQELWECLLKYFHPVGTSIANESSQIENEQKLLKKLKTNFVMSNQTTYSSIKKAIEDGDIKLAHRLVHTLKSNAGQIMKEQLQRAAAVVESTFCDGKNLSTKAQMDRLESELQMTLDELAPLLSDNNAEKPDRQTNKAEQANLFEHLEEMLKKRNPECINLIEKISLLPETEDLVYHIEDLDFKKASEALNTLKEKQKSS